MVCSVGVRVLRSPSAARRRSASPARLVALSLSAVLVCGAAAGCGSERAVRVRFEPASQGDLLCVYAHGEGELAFVSAYPLDDSSLDPSVERSLTFVPGDRIDVQVTISALLERGGLVVAGSSVLSRFGDRGPQQTLTLRRCHPHERSDLGERATGTFAALATDPSLMSADVDGDGREELLALGSTGALLVLDAEERGGGSRTMSELRAPGGRLVTVGDVDGDCRLELVAGASTGALVVVGSSGISPPPVGGAATDVAIGAFGALGGAGEPALAIAGPGGLSSIDWRGAGAERVLSDVPTRSIESGDLDGDGLVDLVASDESATRLFLGSESGLVETSGGLPAAIAGASALLALGDVDGDGILDLVAAVERALHVATNRGDGFFELRGAPPMAEDVIRRVWVADLDGDCRDDVITLDSMGRVRALGGADPGALVDLGAPTRTVLDAALLDADGDLARELALLDASGGVTLWRP